MEPELTTAPERLSTLSVRLPAPRSLAAAGREVVADLSEETSPPHEAGMDGGVGGWGLGGQGIELGAPSPKLSTGRDPPRCVRHVLRELIEQYPAAGQPGGQRRNGCEHGGFVRGEGVRLVWRRHGSPSTTGDRLPLS